MQSLTTGPPAAARGLDLDDPARIARLVGHHALNAAQAVHAVAGIAREADRAAAAGRTVARLAALAEVIEAHSGREDPRRAWGAAREIAGGDVDRVEVHRGSATIIADARGG